MPSSSPNPTTMVEPMLLLFPVLYSVRSTTIAHPPTKSTEGSYFFTLTLSHSFFLLIIYNYSYPSSEISLHFNSFCVLKRTHIEKQRNSDHWCHLQLRVPLLCFCSVFFSGNFSFSFYFECKLNSRFDFVSGCWDPFGF